MDIFEIPEELTNELHNELNNSQCQGVQHLKNITTKLEKFVHEYSKNILKENNKVEEKYKIDYIHYSKKSNKIITKYDIESSNEINNKIDAFHTSILCLNEVDSSCARIFVCDIDINKYKYKLFDTEPLSLVKIKKNSIIQLKNDSKCYGVYPVCEANIEILVINLIEKKTNTIFKDVKCENESLYVDYDLISSNNKEKEIEMKLSKTFYNDFLYKKECCQELFHITQFNRDFHVLCVKNESKKDADIMETLCDEHGNPIQKFLQRLHQSSVIQKNVCSYLLNEYEETGQIELFMNIKSNLIKLFSHYFNDLYEHLKKQYNIHEKNNVNMNELKIMKTKVLEINSKQLVCFIPLENVIVKTYDNMKYAIHIGDLFVYFNEELNFEKEMKIIYYTISINP
jgi:hypothetical protein